MLFRSAIDLNASKHPLGKENTFTPDKQSIIRDLCIKYNLRWGGDYKDRKDDMHFEIIGSPSEVKALINKLNLKEI